MKIEQYDNLPSHIADALLRFEKEFSYPLGQNQRFKIAHQPNYQSFFTAMGKPITLVAYSNDKQIIGTLTAVSRELYQNGKFMGKVLYLCDLKVHPKQRKSFIFKQLMFRFEAIFLASDYIGSYAIMMDGTKLANILRAGYFKMHNFRHIQTCHLYHFQIQQEKFYQQGMLDLCEELSQTAWQSIYQKAIQSHHYKINWLKTEQISRRAKITPIAYSKDNSFALLEDTLKSKQLIDAHTQQPIESLHLSYFVDDQTEHGIEIIRQAIHDTHAHQINQLFVTLHHEASWMKQLGKECAYNHAKAYLFSIGQLPHCDYWLINSSEI